MLIVQSLQFRINEANAEHAHDYVKEITFAFMKQAANRKGDDLGKIKEYLEIDSGCCRRCRGKEGWQKQEEEGRKELNELYFPKSLN